ncbi:hypothetical protein V22_08120 [Calycomorphotria hydatis]|uniref:Uncharacterized protein n=1 Tax=Calycomorphotria hydatis TaxID=2528027 RepID=A0A517T5E8_9PLAN|nr:hypothetical protein V22_08120 [Calycomorphotria hydatis]
MKQKSDNCNLTEAAVQFAEILAKLIAKQLNDLQKGSMTK